MQCGQTKSGAYQWITHSRMNRTKTSSKLRSLLVFVEEEEDSFTEFLLSTLFPRGFRLLKVLDLQGVSLLEIFPREIVKLFHLRYLSLRGTKGKNIPGSVKKLQNLEILDLKQAMSLMSAEILNLKRLRHLLVYCYEIESYAYFDSKYGFKVPLGIGNLQSLQKRCFVEAENSAIITELGKMSQLRRLGIIKFREKDGVSLCSSIEKLTELTSLSITSEDKDIIIDLHHVSFVPESLQRLYLAGRLEELIMKLRPDGGEDYWKVAHVPAVYSCYWINCGWDVCSIERFSERENSQQGSAVRIHKRSTIWKV